MVPVPLPERRGTHVAKFGAGQEGSQHRASVAKRAHTQPGVELCPGAWEPWSWLLRFRNGERNLPVSKYQDLPLKMDLWVRSSSYLGSKGPVSVEDQRLSVTPKSSTASKRLSDTVDSSC